MLSAFAKDESGGIVVAYGLFAMGLILAMLALAGMMGSVLGQSYSAIPEDAVGTVPALDALSRAGAFLDGLGLGDALRFGGGGM